MTKLAARCKRMSDADWFQNSIIGVILFNAAVLGLETYPGANDKIGDQLNLANEICLLIFTVELAIRLVAYHPKVGRFFSNGWNVFDFVVVSIAYIPLVRESATLLRLARLLRVARLLSVMPGLRVIITGMKRSLAPLGSLVVMTFFLLYFYGMLGWLIYADHDPGNFGTIGRSLGTLFQVLTIEGWNEILDTELEYTQWSWLYFISFILMTSFVVINVVIGIVVNSMDEAREIEHQIQLQQRLEEEHAGHTPQEWLPDRIETLREAVEDLETELRRRGQLPKTDP